MDHISVQKVLAVLDDFDQFGGASMELVAWELFVHRQDVINAWTRTITARWVQPGEHNTDGEQLWRLTLSGRAAMRSRPASTVR